MHRGSEIYLIAMDRDEARHIEEKVRNGNVIWVNKVIYAASDEFDEFVEYLKDHKLEKASNFILFCLQILNKN